MTDSLKIAEQMVERLIAAANEAHTEDCWTYELTSEVDNIEVSSGAGTRTLRVHPCWLRYVVTQGEFASCVAGEIEAWYLLAELTAA
jgi:hypothetical protein